MSVGILYGAYFSNLRTILAIVLPLVSIFVLYGIFRMSRNPNARSWSLSFMLLSSIFLWLFLGVSLVLCYAFAESYEYELEAGVRAVFGRTILISIAGGLPFSLLLRHISPRIVLRKVGGLSDPSQEVAESFKAIAQLMRVPSAELKLSKEAAPVSFAIQDKKTIVVMSESLLPLLKKDELEAVMAHELAHIKNSDTFLKAMVTAYRIALPHDPIIRLVEAAFHREREITADQAAAKTTGKPLSLASALLKIYEAFPRSNLASHGSLSILGAGSTLMSRHPPIRYRISQLVHLAESYR